MSASSLKEWLAAEIGANGPMPVERYMRECLLHERFGYYRNKQAIGAAGDFVTAPEISQVFGELIGIWVAAAWTGLGEPKRWRLIELGPGRGTLMADLLRALKVLPAARMGVEVVLVEANGVLAAEQRGKLAGCDLPIAWVGETGALAALPPLPTVLIANEFLDALPIRQFVAVGGKWHERCVDLEPALRPAHHPHPEEAPFGAVSKDGRGTAGAPHASFETRPVGAPQDEGEGWGPGSPRLRLVVAPLPLERGGEGTVAPAPDGAIHEVMSGASTLIAELAALSPAYLLFIDYGHEGPVHGDTLQAVTGHHFADPLAAPGQADLSAQVDFAQVRAAALAAGFEATAPVSQAEFLGRLGATERLERLCRDKDAATVQAQQIALARLMQPIGMGGRFKALAVASNGLARPPVF